MGDFMEDRFGGVTLVESTLGCYTEYDGPRRCKCCDGAGTQMGFDGIKVRCVCCGGTGDWGNDAEHG